MIHLVESEDVSSTSHRIVQLPTIRIGAKRLHVTVELEDSDEEDDWLLESTPDVGPAKRRMWMNPLNVSRPVDGEYVRICLPLRNQPDRFRRYFRMSVPTYDYILKEIAPDITKNSIRPSIIPGERLAVTVRFLATGTSYEALADTFLMDGYTIGLIVKEVCEAIFRKFSSLHMAPPTPEEYKKIAYDYERQWNMPNVIGAIDGKHIRIKRPPQSGTMFYNYKLFYSIVLQAVVDSNYRFLFIDVGAYGKQSDAGVFDASTLSKYIADRKNFPGDCFIQGLSVQLPYFFVADDAYPLRRNIMKPYSYASAKREEMIFNGRLSRARRCVECAFGIMANKWRLFLKPIETHDKVAVAIVKAATVLHNIVIDREGVERDSELIKAVRMQVKMKVDRIVGDDVSIGRRYNRSSSEALTIRKYLTEYVNSAVGSVPWNERYIKT